ncbi:MAG: hypothetical protein QMD09_15575 [Desulfatibacillaceae bacterium]|nr:hypothetical protein [Desulfatibacillaceae bacterium]
MREYFGSPYFSQFLALMLAYLGLFLLALVVAQVVLRRPGAFNPLKGAFNCWIVFFGVHFFISAIVAAFSLQAMATIPEPWYRMLAFSAPLLIMALINLGLCLNLVLGSKQIRY